jgi:DNA-binding NarL/FixJ family response regulator
MLKMINVMIVDDHAMFRNGVRKILESTTDIRIVNEACGGHELVEKLSGQVAVDILLLDISMPDIGGFDVLDFIRTLRPELSIVVLSMYKEEQYIIRAMNSGCMGYIVKSSTPEELIDAIGAVSRGEQYISLIAAQNLSQYYVLKGDKKL